MYRKNTANQYIYFCLVNATTGAALTGATVTAYRALDNGSQAAATGTTTELANGQYRFNLSQADTNSENGSYLFVATSAVPVEKTVVFTSANPSDAAAFGLSNFDAAISSRMATFTQPTGFLAATFPSDPADQSAVEAAITAAQVAIIAQVDANETKIDSIQSDTNDIQTRLPAALESGRIAAVLDSGERNTLVDLVWDEAMSGHTTAGTYGGRIVRATNSNTDVQITGSNHIAADIHNLQSGVITAADFAADSITASALATDAVTEIQSGLATAAALATESGKITNIENASGYLLAVLAGECADPQTASETYAITVFGSTFTVDMAGQTSTGTRTAPTLTKT